MEQRKLLLGPPGCGKTHRLISEVEMELAQGTRPDQIAVVSFTRKAVEEARDRACAKFNLQPKDLPWFRTLHSLGLRMLGLPASDIMTQADWKDFGRGLGIDIKGVDDRSARDGLIIAQTVGGDKYVSLIERSIMRCIPLEQEFSEANDWSLSWPMLRKVEQELAYYKSTYNKFSFVDMINEVVVQELQGPRLKLLVVDEAQDLTPLQWRMVELLADNAERVIFAGDDDQAIHRWAGVNVKLFMESSRNTEVLSQSFRLPLPVYEASIGISARIQNRLPKRFFPAPHEGSVSRVLGPRHLELREGKWMVLARTNAYVQEWAKRLRQDGYMFQVYGNSSVNPKMAEAIKSWRMLQRGEALPLGALKTLYEVLPKQGDDAALKRGSTKLLEAMDPTASYCYDQLVATAGMIADRSADALRVLNLGYDDAEYIRSLERRGEDITGKPRIKISTGHAAKGGEEDNVAVDLSSTKACVNTRFPDDEHRTMYVCTSRAKKNLVLIHTDKEFRYVV
jgi:superfamily I DNA/RNA helicase